MIYPVLFEEFKVEVTQTSLFTGVLTSLGLPHSLRAYKSDSEETIFGGRLSAPLGFDGTQICTKVEHEMQMNKNVDSNHITIGFQFHIRMLIN